MNDHTILLGEDMSLTSCSNYVKMISFITLDIVVLVYEYMNYHFDDQETHVD